MVLLLFDSVNILKLLNINQEIEMRHWIPTFGDQKVCGQNDTKTYIGTGYKLGTDSVSEFKKKTLCWSENLMEILTTFYTKIIWKLC